MPCIVKVKKSCPINCNGKIKHALDSLDVSGASTESWALAWEDVLTYKLWEFTSEYAVTHPDSKDTEVHESKLKWNGLGRDVKT